jgi:hypothetical protein
MSDVTKTVSLTFVYEELAEFFASAPTVQQITELQLSPEADQFLSDLLEANRTRGLLPDEKAVLDQYTAIERLMQFIKLRAFANLEKQ